MTHCPRALVLFEYATLNGGEYSFLSATPHLLKSEFEITACLFEEGPLRKKLETLSLKAHHLGFPRSASQSEKRATLKNFLRENRADLIHANSLSTTRLSAPVAKELGIPHVGHLRDIANVSSRTIDDLSQSHRLLAVSIAVKDWYARLGIPAERLHVLYNGVDLTRFAPGPPSKQIRGELELGDGPIILGIGQLGLRKGFQIWLQAAEIIAERFPGARFLIAGEQHSQKAETAEHVRQLQSSAGEGSLAGKVHWLGRREDIPDLLRESDLLLHAARQEPLGRVLLEAIATGTPIVATDVGGTREILPAELHEVALACVDAPQNLAEKAISLLASPERRGEIGRIFRQTAIDHFSAERAAAGLLGHYRAVYDGAAAHSSQSR